MCGITGVLRFHSRVSSKEIETLNSSLLHRGPDGQGIWVSEAQEIGLGHRRLSIVDLSSNANQPMVSSTGRYVISFNGEIYNYIELKRDLLNSGAVFKSNSDTEVILHLYEKYRNDAFKKLDGMFAIAIWDKKKQELICARDRFGEKPFYYFKDSTQFIFASEIKALLKIGVSKEKNFKAYYNYLLYNVLDNPLFKTETFYKKIHKILPGSFVVLNKQGEWKEEKYWSLENDKIDISFEEACNEFNRLFNLSIHRRLRSDVPIGSSLSGGLDSSSIVASIKSQIGEHNKQKTFSAKFPGFERDESKYINKLNTFLGVDSYDVLPTEESVFTNLMHIAYHQDEPFDSLSIATQFEVMKSAAQNNITVLLDGQGADEYLLGYQALNETFLREVYTQNKTLFKTYLSQVESIQGFTIDKSQFGFQTLKNNFSKVNNLKRKMTKNSSSYFLGIHPELVQSFKNIPNPLYKGNSVKDHSKFYLFEKGLTDLLRYADRNSMANSIEVRLPFLNHDLVQFAFSLPSEYLIGKGWTKYILRQTMDKVLPEEICWRKDKVGYEPPQRKWLETDKFQGLFIDSVRLLQKEKIISTPNPSHSWKYITLAMFHQL